MATQIKCLLLVLTIIALLRVNEARPLGTDLQAASLYMLVNDGTYHVTMTRRVKLYSMSTKQHLRIHGSPIDGLGKRSAPDARLIIESVGFGLVRIKGARTGNFLCFTRKGHLIGKGKDINRFCVFKEIFDAYDFHNYQSLANSSWFVGLRKNGKPKRGQKTLRGHKESQFLLLPW